MPGAKKSIDAFLANIGYPLLFMSAVGLHLFTAFTAYNLVAPGGWRYVATAAALAYVAIAEAVVAYYAWRDSGSMINAYSVWILAWGLLLIVVLGLATLHKHVRG
jgi:hypothetical protein